MRLAVIGLGNAAETLHLPALRGIPNVTLVGGVDPNEDRRRQMGTKFDVPTFESFDALLAATELEVALVGTPPDSHAAYCLQALDAGAHVICEKPFVTSLAEADQVIAAAEATGRHIALNHPFREMPIFRAVKDAIGSQGVGSLVVAQVWQLMDLPPWQESGWRRDMPMQVLFEAGIHLVDYAMYLFGERPHAVSATMSTCGVKDIDSDAVTAATLEFSGGRVAQVWQNRFCKGETQFFEVRADCQEASLRASYGGRVRLSAGLHRSTRPHLRFEYGMSGLAWRENGHRRSMIARNPKDPPMLATRTVLANTVRAFAEGTEPPASAQVGRDGLEVLAGLYHAARTGQRINLDDTAALVDVQIGVPPAP